MGVPGFYSWLIKRYPLVKHMIDKYQLPSIDYLYLDMNGIIYKCVKDDSIIFKSEVLPKELEEIWLQIFNYINMIVSILKPNKMIFMALDGVAPRSKMNNQRARRFKSARDHTRMMEKFYDYKGDTDSQENFKNNSITPGTEFMEQLNKNLDFFIKKKIEQDDYWKNISVVFTGSDVPGEGEHKIMQFIRAHNSSFGADDTHCLYGADADLIMLSMVLPLKNLCIIRQQYVPTGRHIKIIESRKQKNINFQLIFVTILREYFEIEYNQLAPSMKMEFHIQKIIADFVFLFFFIGNDFLPRCMAYNIREQSVEDLIDAFKQFLIQSTQHIVGNNDISMPALALLSGYIAKYELKFISEKGEEIQRVIQSKMSIQRQLSNLMRQKAQTDKQFLLQLKASLMNQDLIKYKSLYYSTKFQIDPIVNVQQFSSILIYYFYGLKFVYEYYFIGLPSWQWYYPYYYAPLISDLSLYLQYLSTNGFKPSKIEPGKPFQPFKQLMCILPKNSWQLLPKQFHNYVQQEDSILRSPYDFYPDDFEDDPYGSIRAHEAISLIPFLDLTKINQAYNQAISEVSGKDLKRNEFNLSILYQFNEQAEEIAIESDFASLQSVNCPIQIRQVDLQKAFEWKNKAGKKTLKQNLFRMPTLKIRNFSYITPTRKRSFVISIEDKAQVIQGLKLGMEVFYGYPLEHSGKVEGILTFQNFQCIGNFDPYNYFIDQIFGSNDFLDVKSIQKHCKQAFNGIQADIAKQYQNSILWKGTKTLIFVADTMSYMRCLDGEFRRIYVGNKPPSYSIVPIELLTKTRRYENTRDNIIFRSLQEQFALDEYIIVFLKEPKNNETVYKGVVKGYNQMKKLVRVEVSEKIKKLPDVKLQNYIHTRQLFFTLKFSAFLLGVKPSILLTLLDSISIYMEGNADLPSSIDIGLNFISRREKKIVANLVRINLYQDGHDERHIYPRDIDVQKSFNKLQISLRGLEIIIEYRKRFSEIFNFIEARHQNLIQKKSSNGRIDWKQTILLSSLYKQQDIQRSVKLLMSVYIWLIQKEETHMPLSSLFSKQVSKKNINKMQEIFEIERRQKIKKYAEKKVIQVDPNYLFSKRLADIGCFHLALDQSSKGPPHHAIRDQVICLNPQSFGHFGIIVGIDNQKYEVLFNKPSFGKSNLNGLCKALWGGKFFERQLYNLETWPSHLHARQYSFQKGRQHLLKFGYIGSNEAKVPKFKEKALNSFADIETLERKANKQIFSKQFLEYVAEIKVNRQVSKIDPQYQVVDSRGKKYEYRYDNGISSVSKDYVQKIQKNQASVEKPTKQVVEQLDTVSKQYEKQVIYNKLVEVGQQQTQDTKQEINRVEGEIQEDQEDDILTSVN